MEKNIKEKNINSDGKYGTEIMMIFLGVKE